MIDVPCLAEVSTQPCKRKDPFPGYCMYNVHGVVLWYMAQRSAECGRWTHIVINPHRRAEVFGALLEIASGPWPVNVASCSAAKPNPPLRCQPVLAGCFRGGTTTMVATSIRENILAHNPVYNLTIFR